MKGIRIMAVIALVLAATSCGILAEAQAEEDAIGAECTARALEQGELCFEVDRILPMRGPSFPSNDGYRITVKDGEVDGFLPFFGESYTSVVYGSDNTGIKFEHCPVYIDESQSKPSKGKYVWNFAARSGMEKVYVTITFFSNGSADVSCKPTNRTLMNYNGRLIPIKEK